MIQQPATRRAMIAATAMLLLAAPAMAHGPAGNKPVGTHGGEIVDVDGGHLELLVEPGELRVYVTDLQDVPLPSAGLTARAIIQQGANQTVLSLTPKEPNLLVAPLAAPLGKAAKVAVSTTLARNGKPVQARFVVK